MMIGGPIKVKFSADALGDGYLISYTHTNGPMDRNLPIC